MEYEFTLSIHFYKPNSRKNHLDLFLDAHPSEELLHYKAYLTQIKNDIKEGGHFTMFVGRPHRRVYLSFQGMISGNRGKIRIIKNGKTAFCVDKPPQRIKLNWPFSDSVLYFLAFGFSFIFR